MTDSHIKLGGAVIFWTLAEYTDQAKLETRLTDAGFGDMAPPLRTATAVLKDALSTAYADTRHLVRPLRGGAGFTVVKEIRGDSENQYQPEMSVTTNDSGWLDFIHASDPEKRTQVRDIVGRHLRWLRSNQVAAMLVRIVARLGGTTLRPTGGVYWIPEGRLKVWREAVDAVEYAAVGKTHACYILRHQMDADAVRAVRDAVCAEVLHHAQVLNAEILGGSLGRRALESRRDEAEDLRMKVQMYETLLETGLSTLRDVIDETSKAAATAILLASTDDVAA